MTLADAYAACRTIAKREAKNFYYSFRVLPAAKRDAMCAVYAFMRRADDIADDETMPIAERRQAMARWMDAWRSSGREGKPDGPADPVFVALEDATRRFSISNELLDELVQGTSMDLDVAGSGTEIEAGLQGYKSFGDLYRYCYLVASVVGLVCIRIFGHKDARAETLAEKTGIAFQLTNILRDVKEDAARGRLYLPMDLMDQFGVSAADVLALASGRAVGGNERALIAALSAKAWHYYAAADELVPMVDADSRAALWVLVKIYSNLLARIDARNGDVFSKRVSVPTSVKLAILAQGIGKALWNRVAV